MSATKVPIPFFGIQCDWDESLRKKGGTAWISVREPGKERCVHGELKCLSESPLSIESHEPFEVLQNKLSTCSLSVKDTLTKSECSYVAPFASFSEIHKKNITCMDVTEGGLGLSVCSDNVIKVWETDTGTIRRTFNGHPVDVYTCKFFPSGIVALSGGADMVLKIWSVETGDCPVTLKGHTGAILDTCIVERGRNVLSISRDGSAKLWDCGESKCITTITKDISGLNCCCLIAPFNFDVGSPISPMSEREVGTNGKLLLLGNDDGKIEGYGVASRSSVFRTTVPSAATTIAAIGPNTFAVGCQGGQIVTFDLRKVVSSKEINCATPTPILDFSVHPRTFMGANRSTNESSRCFWAAKNDGTCALINPSLGKDHHFVQLTGPDSDPVYKVKHDGNSIYTACRDGVIRKYSINLISKLFQ